VLRDVAQEPEGFQKIRLPSRIGPDDDIERAQLHIELSKALEVGDVDLLDGHGVTKLYTE
jgi:hypothetical protein